MTRPTNMSATPTVLQVGQMKFVGNIIPHTWYGQLTLPNGKPYLNAIIILSDIVYWYRSTEVRDEATGKLLGTNRKFHADLLQRTYESFADQFGLSKGQCQDAIKYLEDKGLITRVFRTVKTETGLVLCNVLFIDLHVDRLREVTYPDLEQDLSGSEETPLPIERDTPLDETPDITEITTETTSEISTNITHHHKKRAEHGGGVKEHNKGATAQQITMESEDRTVKEELALALMEFVAPTFNQGKNFVRNLSDDRLDGLGAWLMLLKKDHDRLSEIKTVPGYLRTQVLKGEYPDDEDAWTLWQQGVELYKTRSEEPYFDMLNSFFVKLRLY